MATPEPCLRPMREEELAQFPPEIAEKLRQMHTLIDESPREYTEKDFDEMSRQADLEDAEEYRHRVVVLSRLKEKQRLQMTLTWRWRAADRSQVLSYCMTYMPARSETPSVTASGVAHSEREVIDLVYERLLDEEIIQEGEEAAHE